MLTSSIILHITRGIVLTQTRRSLQQSFGPKGNLMGALARVFLRGVPDFDLWSKPMEKDALTKQQLELLLMSPSFLSEALCHTCMASQSEAHRGL